MNEEEPSRPDPAQSVWAPMFTGRGTEGLAKLRQGTHRASGHNLTWHKRMLTLQASRECHTHHPQVLNQPHSSETL